MADKTQEVGSIVWTDLTVPDAAAVRDFYREVVGWRAEEVDMGGYNDFNMVTPGDGKVTCGVCYARGVNATLPPVWLMYVLVADLDRSLERCAALGGAVLDGPRAMGGARFAVIRDPAGAVAALYARTK